MDPRFQQDMFAATHTFDDQPRLAARAFEIAKRTGARIIRVFSYWRTVRPEECFDRIVAALRRTGGPGGAARRDHRARERARLQHRDRAQRPPACWRRWIIRI